MHKYEGTGVALVTPFNKDKSIDFDALANIIEYVIAGGVSYVVSMGTTGEAATLAIEERYRILAFTADVVQKRVPLVAGFGGNNTQQIVKQINNAPLTAVDAILSASPHYNKPTQEGIYQHYKYLNDSTPLPIIMYNVPSRTASNIEASTSIKIINNCPNITAIKEASGDIIQCMEIIKNNRRADFAVLSGDDLITLAGISCGMKGVISVLANAFPAQVSSLVKASLKHDIKVAQKLQYNLYEITQLLFAENNPAGVKAVLHTLGLCKPYVRLPLVPATTNLNNAIQKLVHLLLNKAVKKTIH